MCRKRFFIGKSNRLIEFNYDAGFEPVVEGDKIVIYRVCDYTKIPVITIKLFFYEPTTRKTHKIKLYREIGDV